MINLQIYISDFLANPAVNGSKIVLTPTGSNYITGSTTIIPSRTKTQTISDGYTTFSNIQSWPYYSFYFVDGYYKSKQFTINIPSTATGDINAKDYLVAGATTSSLNLPYITGSIFTQINEPSVYFTFNDFQSEALVDKPVTLTPLSRSLTIHGNELVVDERKTIHTDTSGYVIFNPCLAGPYKVKIDDGDEFYINVPDTTGSYNGKDLLCYVNINSNFYSSASYALTASYALNGGGSTPSVSASYVSGSNSVIASLISNNIDFTGSTNPVWKEGRLFYDYAKHSLSVYNDKSDVTLNIGEENWIRGVNKTGVLIPNGSVVTVLGSQGNRPQIVLAQSTTGSLTDTNYEVIGIATQDININEEGIITIMGIVNGINTAGYTTGDVLYLSATAGEITNIKPIPPYCSVKIGVALNSTSNGSILVYVQNAIHLHDISNISSSTYTNGDILVYNSTKKVWANQQTFSGVAATASYAEKSLYSVATKEPTGFPNRTDSVYNWDNTNRIFSISASATSYKIYSNGNEYTKTIPESVTIPATRGINNFVYFNESTLALTTSPTEWTFEDGNVPVAVVTIGGTGNGWISDERHGIVMDGATHHYLHDSFGARYQSGFTLTVPSASGLHWITAGRFADEDLIHQTLTTTSQSHLAYVSASLIISQTASSSYWSGGVPKYNTISTGATTDIPANRFGAFFIYSVNTNPVSFISVMGQRIDTTLANAQANNTPESLVLGNFPFTEAKLLYRCIVQGSATATTNITDYRSAQIAGNTTYTPTAHVTLTGLQNDDHQQYLLLAGRTGGQTVAGGITASLQGTASWALNAITSAYAATSLTSSNVYNGGNSVNISLPYETVEYPTGVGITYNALITSDYLLNDNIQYNFKSFKTGSDGVVFYSTNDYVLNITIPVAGYGVDINMAIPANADGVRVLRNVNSAGYLDGYDFTANGIYQDDGNTGFGEIVWNNGITTATPVAPHYIGNTSLSIGGNVYVDGNITASTFAGNATSATSASYARSASWAPSAGGGTTLTTGSTYPITASWANNIANQELFIYTGSADFTTTSTAAINVPGLTYNLDANSMYNFDAFLVVNSDSAAGMKPSIYYSQSGSATLECQIWGRTTAAAMRNDRLTTFSGLITAAYSTVAAQDSMIRMEGVIITGAGAGSMAVQVAKVTSGNLTVYQGGKSWLKLKKIY